jgi:uncharacterized membrane protein YccC
MPSDYPREPSWYIVFTTIMIFILAILAATLAFNAPVPL